VIFGALLFHFLCAALRADPPSENALNEGDKALPQLRVSLFSVSRSNVSATALLLATNSSRQHLQISGTDLALYCTRASLSSKTGDRVAFVFRDVKGQFDPGKRYFLGPNCSSLFLVNLWNLDPPFLRFSADWSSNTIGYEFSSQSTAFLWKDGRLEFTRIALTGKGTTKLTESKTNETKFIALAIPRVGGW
jgi:hypothetical protein